MLLQKLINDCKSILCLDGDLPQKECFPDDKVVVAADGAANKLVLMGIIPNVIIGDLDSVDRSKFKNSKIMHVPNQDVNDFQKALNYIKENSLEPALIYGASGGFIDHILNNISIIIENNCSFYTPPIIGLVIEGEAIFEMPLNTKISIFGFNTLISSQGLKWELKEDYLNFPGKNSSFNRTAESIVKIRASGGKALVLFYETSIDDCGIS